VKWKEKKSVKRDELARLFQKLSRDIAGGVIEYSGRSVALPEDMEVEVEYKEKHGKNKFEIELKWKKKARGTMSPSATLSEAPHPVVKVASIEELSPWKVIRFEYPSGGDEAVLISLPNGELRAYSLVCPHKGKYVTWNASSRKLYCSAHKAFFNPEDGEKIEGPGRERLTRIRLEVRGGEVFAVGIA